MRYAVISDVHGNLESLERALALLAPDDALICLGDMVGYGPNPNECVRLLRDRTTHAVLGNHDLAALENFGTEYFNDAARAAIEWTQRNLDAESRTWLNGLSYELRLPDFLLVHGAPVNYFEYILDKRAAARAFEQTDARLIFIG
ncbi:MAG TPA: metallophosphoesterase family protein, partial [Candidatus Tumulicola sp.]|nr:metallophosphoesterase family protein [Candidatus Tumulicola sp.]